MDSHAQVGGRQGRIHLFCARLKSWPFNYAICWKRCARDQEAAVRQLQEFSSVQEHDVVEVCCLKQQVSCLRAPVSLLSWVVANAVMAMAAVVAMPPKAMKAPKAVAKPKEKAKAKAFPKVKAKAAAVKTEQSSPAKRPRPQEAFSQQVEAGAAADAGGNAEVSKADVSNFLGRLKNSADPNHQKVLLEYQMLPRYDKSKAELIRKWKMDRSCSWAMRSKKKRKRKPYLPTRIWWVGSRSGSWRML